jgi:hypothetical protein
MMFQVSDDCFVGWMLYLDHLNPWEKYELIGGYFSKFGVVMVFG